MIYGAMTAVDARVMDEVFQQFHDDTLRVVEVGVWKGDTARGMKQACEKNACGIDYYGIDVAAHAEPNPPFDGAHYIVCPSEQAHLKLYGLFDVVFIDACHCRSHVILDAVAYGSKVIVGGFIIFHDTAPHLQHVQKNHWVHSDHDNPDTLTAVRDALTTLGWPNERWSLWCDKFDPESDIGGMMVFRRSK